ncbi:MAG: antitoxin VapB family protein [Nanoarchaeota archaeon]
MVTTIQLDEKTKNKLDGLKIHHRESYNEILQKLIEVYCKNEEVVETLEIISDPEAMREIAEALDSYNAGKRKTLAQFRKELGV